MPTAHRLTCFRPILETHALQGFKRFGIILRAGENERTFRGGQITALFEEARIMALNLARFFGQCCREGFQAGKASKFSKACQRVFVDGQALRLLICHHL